MRGYRHQHRVGLLDAREGAGIRKNRAKRSNVGAVRGPEATEHLNVFKVVREAGSPSLNMTTKTQDMTGYAGRAGPI
jgi:hypothetical protein